VHEALRQSGRLGWLDALRGMALLWVVMLHIHFYTCPVKGTLNSAGAASFSYLLPVIANSDFGIIRSAFHALLALGYQGVHIFFVASGFSLTLSVLRKGDQPRWLPWARRHFWHLFGLYWLAHAVFWGGCWLRHDWSAMPVGKGALLSLLALNWTSSKYVWYGPDAWWFVRMLMQFYLLFPLLFWTLRAKGPLLLGVGALLVTLAFRAAMLGTDSSYVHTLANYGFCGARLFEFSLGMAVAWVVWKRPGFPQFRLRYVALSGLVWGCGVALCFVERGSIFSGSLIALGLFPLGAWLAARTWRVWRLGSGLSFIGRHSYGVYLVHGPPIPFLLAGLGAAGFGRHAAGVMVITTLALIVLGLLFDVCGATLLRLPGYLGAVAANRLRHRERARVV